MTNDERRERYAAAIDDVGYIGDAFPAVLDAAMAVADAELRVRLGEQADRYMAVLRLLEDEQDENARLRAELARANQRLVIADEMQQERVCLTPDYDRSVGPCHCAHCDPASLERDNERLRAELETAVQRGAEAEQKVIDMGGHQLEAAALRAELVKMQDILRVEHKRANDAVDREIVADDAAAEHRATIERVHGVLYDAAGRNWSGESYHLAFRAALKGEQS